MKVLKLREQFDDCLFEIYDTKTGIKHFRENPTLDDWIVPHNTYANYKIDICSAYVDDETQETIIAVYAFLEDEED